MLRRLVITGHQKHIKIQTVSLQLCHIRGRGLHELVFHIATRRLHLASKLFASFVRPCRLSSVVCAQIRHLFNDSSPYPPRPSLLRNHSVPFLVRGRNLLGLLVFCLSNFEPTPFHPSLQLFAARIALHALAWPHQEKMSNLQSFVITTLMTSGALLVSLVTDDIALVLGIGGSIFTSYISMILPAQIYLRVLNMRAQKDGGLLDPRDRWSDNVDLERLVNDEAETQVASAFEIARRPEQIKYEMVKASVLLLTGLVVGVVGFGATLWFR